MEPEKESMTKDVILNNRMQNILTSLTKCKIEYSRDRNECQKLQEINTKLVVELKEARELEKSHRCHLLSCREMIGNLQETVTHLVHLKRDIKKLKDEITSKDSTILVMEKERENMLRKHNESLMELKSVTDRRLEEMAAINEKKIQQAQHDAETQVAQMSCLIEELRAKMKDMEAENRDKMNMVVLEYEEKLQRSAAQVTQLRDQHAGLIARTDANIEAYRRRLEEIEEKLKQSQFKQYLAQSALTTQYDTQQGERPYSANRDPYPDEMASLDLDPVLETRKPKAASASQSKVPNRSAMNTLQVNYYGGKVTNTGKNAEKKGQFNIVKKRKLYNEKDFADF